MLTLQALGEFFHATTRKRIAARHDAAAQVRDLLAIFPTVAADADAFGAALAGAERGNSSFWDGLLVATAARAGCAYLLSENMQHGARVDGAEILDPFSGEELPERVARLLR